MNRPAPLINRRTIICGWATSALGDRPLPTVLDSSSEGVPFEKVAQGNSVYDAAFNKVTPLSLPYVLARFLPQLRAAADGDVGTKIPA